MREPDDLQSNGANGARSTRCEQVKSAGALGRLRLWVAKTFVARVPDDVARCEFECRVASCAPEKIQACEQRIDYARKQTVADAPAEDVPQ